MADEEKETLDPLAFDAYAEGIFSTVTDPVQGQAALLSAYNNNDWSEPEKVLEALSFYGEEMRNLYKDQSLYGGIGVEAPVKYSDIEEVYGEEVSNQLDLHDAWEEENLKVIKESTDPKIVVDRRAYEESVKAYASQKRQQQRQQNLKESAIDGTVLEGVAEVGGGIALDIAGSVAPVTNFLVNTLTDYSYAEDSFDIKKYTTEILDPDYQKSWTRTIAGAGGQALATVANPLTMLTGQVANAFGETEERFSETQRLTGDTGAAYTAAGIEGVSQAVGFFGEKIGLASLGNNLAGKTVGKLGSKVIAKTGGVAFAEGGTEGLQQIGSNVSENIQQGKSVGTDVFRGVGKAAVAGTLAGGAAEAGVTVFTDYVKQKQSLADLQNDPGETDTGFQSVEEVAPAVKLSGLNEKTDRQTEADEFGQPITPQTIQKVAAQEDIVEDVDVTSDEDLSFPTEGTEEATTELTPLYETEDGYVASKDAEGNTVLTSPNTGKPELAYDTVVYLNEDTASKVITAVGTGEAHFTLNPKGEPVLKSTKGDDDENTVAVDHSLEPAEGLYAVPLSTERSPNGSQNIRPMGVPRKVTTMLPSRSLGAAGPETAIEQKETTFSRRLAATEDLNDPMAETGKQGIFFTPLTFDEMDSELRHQVNGNNVASLVDYLENPAPKDPRLEARAAVALTNKFESEFRNNEGDLDAIEVLTKQWDSVAQTLALKGTIAGQTLVFHKGKRLARISATVKAIQKHTEEAYMEEAEASGLSVEDIRSPDKLDKDIQTVQEQIAKTEQEEDAPLHEEELLTKQLVDELTNEGQLAADEENDTVAEEIVVTTERIDKTEKKLQRKRDKAIAAVQERIAADSVELASEIEANQDKSELTREQIAEQEAKLVEKFKAASETASSEVKTAAAETRRQAAAQKKQKVSSLQATVTKVTERTANIVTEATTKIARLTSAANSTVDPQLKQAAEQKIQIEKTRIQTAKQKEASMKAELQLLKDTPEVDAETETVLSALESGVDISQIPTKRGRKIGLTTKTGNLNLAGLFKKSKGTALPALTALADTINTLAGTISSGQASKAETTGRIRTLQNRINKNKRLVERAKQSDVARPADRRAIDRDKKYLEGLKQRTPATAEAKLPKAKATKLAKHKVKLKEIQDKRSAAPKSNRVSELEQQLRNLETKKAQATRANKEAKKNASAKIAQALKASEEIEAKEAVIQTLPEGGQKRKLQREVAQQKAAYANPNAFDILYREFITNALLPALGAVVGTGSMLMGTASKTVALGVGTVASGIRHLNLNAQGLSPFTSFISELATKDNWIRGLSAALDILKTGERLGSRFTDVELSPDKVRLVNKDLRNKALTQVQDIREEDYVKYVDKLQYESFNKNGKFLDKLGVATKNAIIATGKAGQLLKAGQILRMFPALEAIISIPLQSAFDISAANFYYNKQLLDIKKGAVVPDGAGGTRPMTVDDLVDWKYDSKVNRTKARVQAADYANKLRATGIEFSAASQRLLEEEVYQSLVPKYAALVATKQVGQLNLNAPASGVSGWLSQSIMAIAQGAEDTAAIPYNLGKFVKFIVPFANSSANILGFALEHTPFGLLQSNSKSAYERQMALTTASIGSAAMASLFFAVMSELEKPEEKRLFDIIGSRYSKNKGKYDAFKQSGGLDNSIRVGNTYIPFIETPFVLLLGALGAHADKIRDGKNADPGGLGLLTAMTFGSVDAATQISMLRGVNELGASFSKVYKGDASAGLSVMRSLLTPIKTAIIPASGLLKTISRYTDNPVEGWKDTKSFLVEGVPGLQTYAGKHKLNIFGEELQGTTDTAVFRRFFSTKGSDLDMRWLVDNDYNIPSVNNLEVSKSEAVQAGLRVDENSLPKVTENAKADILKRAGPKMRQIVERYRVRYGVSKHSKQVQGRLTADINRQLSIATVAHYKEFGETED